MALKKVMNTDGSIGHSVGSLISGGTFTITSVASTKVKAVGKGVYKGVLNFTFIGGSAAGYVPNLITGSGSISPTATKVKADGSLVIREDDSGTLSGIGPTLPTPPGTPVAISGGVEISSAGQDKVKAQ